MLLSQKKGWEGAKEAATIRITRRDIGGAFTAGRLPKWLWVGEPGEMGGVDNATRLAQLGRL